MSCPYTSQQNGKAQRMLRTANNVTRTLLFQASMLPSYWADALATATHLINRLPTKTLNMSTPFFALHGTLPTYHDLWTFGCSCYPNLTSTTPHKLAPRSTLCTFLGYSLDHKGYWCLDLTTNRVIISRHVVFDETTFPFSLRRPSPSTTELDFLTHDDSSSVPYLSAGTHSIAGPLPSPGPPPVLPVPRPAPVLAVQVPSVPPVQPPVPAVQVPAPLQVVQPPVQVTVAPPVQEPQAPAPLPAPPAFTKPPVVHVYSRRAPAPSSPTEPLPGAPPPPRRSGIVPSPPRYVKSGPSLPVLFPSFRSPTLMAWRPTGKLGTSSLALVCTPRSCPHCRGPAATLSPTSTSVRPWKRSMPLSQIIITGISFLVLPRPMLSPESGFSSTNFMQMGLWTDIRLVGYFVGSLNDPGLIMMKLSALLSSPLRFTQSSPWLTPRTG